MTSRRVHKLFCSRKVFPGFVLLSLLVFTPPTLADETQETIPVNTVPPPPSPEMTGFNLNRYEAKTYTLAYQVFLMNGKPDLAFRIAEAAVKFNPDSELWRKKYAQAALWSGHPEVALQQWLYFFTHQIDQTQYSKEILKLAPQLGNYDAQALVLKQELQKNPTNAGLIIDYAKAMQGQGFPTQAEEFLKQQADWQNKPDYWQQFIRIAAGLAEPKALESALKQYLQLKPKDETAQLQLMELYYTQGQLQTALSLCRQMLQSSLTLSPEFWRTYGDLAMLAGETYQAITAYRQQVKNKQITQADLLNLVNLEYSTGELEQAYQHTRFGYDRFHLPVLLAEEFDFGANLNDWQGLATRLKSLSPEGLAFLQKKPYTFMLLARVYDKTGNKAQAFRSWQTILAKWPKQAEVEETYLWYLLDNQQLTLLHQSLNAWCQRLVSQPKLWEVAIVAWRTLGENRKALMLSLSHLTSISKSYVALFDLADLWAQMDENYYSWLTQKMARNRLLDAWFAKPGKKSLEEELAMTQLLRSQGSAEQAYHAVAYLSKRLFKEPEITNQVVAFALEKENYSLARLIMRLRDTQAETNPAWMAINLALAETDLPLLNQLLSQNLSQLPHRDRVTAAVETGHVSQAQSLSYQGLKEHPKDSQMYDLFRDTLLEGSNTLDIDNRLYNFSPLRGYESDLTGRYFINPTLALKPYNRIWFPTSTDNSLLTNPPHSDRSSGFKARQKTQRGWWESDIAQRKSLRGFPVAGLTYHRDFLTRWQAELSQTYNQRADETAPLLVAGMKDSSQLGLTYLWDSYNLFDAQLNYWAFYGQDYSFLGHGKGASIHWQHKFYLSYPDWNINGSLEWRNYQNSHLPLSAATQSILPAGIPLTPVYYMPVSYNQANFSVGYGMDYRDNYSQRWHSMLSAGLSYADAFGVGRFFSGGFAGSLLGRDMLVLYVDYSDNTQQAGQNIYSIGMRYVYYGW